MKRILMIAVLLGLGGCVADDEPLTSDELLAELPTCALNVRSAGHGWVRFTCEDNDILMSPRGSAVRIQRDMYCPAIGAYVTAEACIIALQP